LCRVVLGVILRWSGWLGPRRAAARGLSGPVHARGGRLEVLRWARARACPWDTGTCAAAARGGHRLFELGDVRIVTHLRGASVRQCLSAFGVIRAAGGSTTETERGRGAGPAGWDSAVADCFPLDRKTEQQKTTTEEDEEESGCDDRARGRGTKSFDA
jgi:hypothetical protein